MSINIKISSWREFSADELRHDVPEMAHRTGFGFREGMTLQEIFDANHGYYTLNRRRASGERLATWSFRGRIVCVAVIHHIVDVSDHRGRPKYVIVGAVVGPDDEHYGWKYKDEVSTSRNPVTYENDNAPERRLQLSHLRPFCCTCGCGLIVDLPGFAPGHAQKALMREITGIFGSIEIFVSIAGTEKYREKFTMIVDEARSDHGLTAEEYVEVEESYHMEKWDDELSVDD